MLQSDFTPDIALAGHADHGDTTVFGFWLYLMTDCIIFAALFATFAVMHNNFAGGPSGRQLFHLSGVGAETGLLLCSSLTYGLAMLAAYRHDTTRLLSWLGVTFLLGAGFLVLEAREFSDLIALGAGPERSAFLSSFFTLVATHGLHVTFGLIWMAVLMVQIVLRPGLSPERITRLTCLSLFWHFLDIVWICVFSFVYLASFA